MLFDSFDLIQGFQGHVCSTSYVWFQVTLLTGLEVPKKAKQ